MTRHVRPLQAEDRRRYLELVVEAFHNPPGLLDHQDDLALDGRFALDEDGRVLGTTRVFHSGQSFGGRFVPVAGIAAVAIAPEARGRGAGGDLLRGLLPHLLANGAALATLWPVAPGIYRALGWEVAGSRLRYDLPLTLVPRHRPAPDVSIAPWDDADLPEIDACYRRVAGSQSGWLDRAGPLWQRFVLHPPSDHLLYRYAVRRGDSLTGYVVLTQRAESAHMPHEFVPGDAQTFALSCRDLVWTDGDTARALLGFLAGHRTYGTRVEWSGPPHDPLLALLDEQEPRVVNGFEWMTRILDVQAAIASRGYPAQARGTVPLRVTDPVLPGNDQAFRIAIADGTGRAEAIAEAPAVIDIGALAAIFTGRLRPRDAARLGRLQGADDSALDLLESAFAGPIPWLPDVF